MFLECTTPFELHEILRTLSFCFSSALAPSNDDFFLNILAFLVFLIHDSLVLCSATCIALDCLFWELFCPFFQSHRGSWSFFYFSFSILFMGDLRLSWNFAVSLCWWFAYLLLFFPDLTPLVKMCISFQTIRMTVLPR